MIDKDEEDSQPFEVRELNGGGTYWYKEDQVVWAPAPGSAAAAAPVAAPAAAADGAAKAASDAPVALTVVTIDSSHNAAALQPLICAAGDRVGCQLVPTSTLSDKQKAERRSGGGGASNEHKEPKLCDCGSACVVSDFQGEPYGVGGWSCNGCSRGSTEPSERRWFCEACANDWCSSCHPFPPKEQAAGGSGCGSKDEDQSELFATVCEYAINGEAFGAVDLGLLTQPQLAALRPTVACGAGAGAASSFSFSFVPPAAAEQLEELEMSEAQHALVQLDLAAAIANSVALALPPPRAITLQPSAKEGAAQSGAWTWGRRHSGRHIRIP